MAVWIGGELEKMKRRIVPFLAIAMIAATAPCLAQTRAEALRPHLDRIRARWANLPAEYQARHRAMLDRYLGEFETANGFTWNRAWPAFARSMGPQFPPFYADVFEAMKVAEAFEAGFPDPAKRLPGIAGAILGQVPTNALLFVHNDILETVLLLQQQSGTRRDVLLFNSSRLMDPSYLTVALDRCSKDLAVRPSEISKAVAAAALRRRDQGDSEFAEVHVKDDRVVRAAGVQLVDALGLLAMREIAGFAPRRPALILPSRRQPEPVQAWSALHRSGLLFTWQSPSQDGPPDDIVQLWQPLIDAAAPAGATVHGEMVNALGLTVMAAADILTARDRKAEADPLLRMWENRRKGLAIVASQDILIDPRGAMLQRPQGPSSRTIVEEPPPANAPFGGSIPNP